MKTLPNIVENETDVGNEESALSKTPQGKEALKAITMAAGKGTVGAFKFTSQNIISPLVNMSLLSELPMLVPILDKVTSSMKFLSTGAMSLFKKSFSKNTPDTQPIVLPESVKNPLGDVNVDDYLFKILSVLELISASTDMNKKAIENTDPTKSIDTLVKSVNQIGKDNREDKNRNSTKEFIEKEAALEKSSKENGITSTLNKNTNKNTDKAFFGIFPPLGFMKAAGSFLLKVTGISFALGFFKKLKPFGKTRIGMGLKKTISKLRNSRFLKAILKPLKLIAGPLMAGLRVGFVAIAGLLTGISLPVLAIVAVLSAITLGVVFLAKKLGDGNIVDGLKVIGSKIKEFIPKFGKIALDGIKMVGNYLWEGLKFAGSYVWDRKEDIIKSIWSGITSIFKVFKNITTSIGNLLKEPIQKMLDGFKNKFTDVLDYISTIPEKLTQFIKDSLSKIPVLGKALSNTNKANIVKKGLETTLIGKTFTTTKTVTDLIKKSPIASEMLSQKSNTQKQNFFKTVEQTLDKAPNIPQSTNLNAITTNVNNNTTNIVQPRSYATPPRNITLGY